MNLERLRAVQADEREADSLRPLPDSFYREVADYIEELRDERTSAADAAADPFDSAEVRRLTDEIETAEEVAEAIYERRVGKLVKRASLAAAGMPTDEAGLTSEEADLFADLVAQIEAHRSDVLASFDGDRGADGGEPGPAPVDSDDVAANVQDGGDDGTPVLDAGDAMGGADGSRPGGGSPEPDSSSKAPSPSSDEPVTEDAEDRSTKDNGFRDASPGSGHPGGPGSTAGESTAGGSTEGEPAGGSEAAGDTERVTLRITRDVGEVFGVDERVYDLAEEDVVTLPAANARPLLDRDAAEEIE